MTKFLVAALGLSTLINAFLALTTRNTALAAQKVVLEARKNADERVRIAEARYDNLLDRIQTAPRIEVRDAQPAAAPLSRTKPYISDFAYDDATWDDLHQPEGEEVT